jgi:Arc/MetJ-type ribon-helix-helix transcriptional regulator
MRTDITVTNQGMIRLALNHKKQIKVTMATPYLDGMNLLIKDGLYETQAEILKDALRRLFAHYEIHTINDACTSN